MAFTPEAPPTRSGDYTRFVTKPVSTVPAGTGDIVALGYTDEWGPVDVPVTYESWQDYLDKNGAPGIPASPSEGFVAVYNAFKGGAGSVLGTRIAGATIAKASRTLAAGATPAALVVTALYEGTRGNLYKTEVVANLADATKRDFRLYKDNTRLLDLRGYGATQNTTLQADINRLAPKHVVVSGATNGTALDVSAVTALTGGNDGLALLAGDFTALRAVLESRRFGYFAMANLTDASAKTAFQAWAKGLNTAEKPKRFFFGTGGAGAETYSTAAAESTGYNDDNAVRLALGTYRDTNLGIVLSTAQLIPRLLGAMAALGGRESLTNFYFDDLEMVTGPTESEIIASLTDGLIVLRLGGDGVAVERGVTTYVTQSDANKPFSTYGKVKFVTTMQSFEREGREVNEAKTGPLGKVVVNSDSREALVAREQRRLNAFIERGEVQPGARVVLSADVPQTDDDEFIAVDWIGKFGRTLEQIRRTVIFS